MKILVFGDVVGRMGREAVKKILPEWKVAHDPDLVIANAENLAHGRGVTQATLDELIFAGVDFFTSGNHIYDRDDALELFADPNYGERLIRPANYPVGSAGEGSKNLTVGTKNVLVVNLMGRVFNKIVVDDPFRSFDEIYAESTRSAGKAPHVVLVDFHGDATSEKNAFGWHAAGRATAVWGTHTHVPTRDERILPTPPGGGPTPPGGGPGGTNGGASTAYITDVGMTGFRDGVIGVGKEEVLATFLTQAHARHQFPEEGDAIVNAILIETGSTGATAITHLQKIVAIP